jgi:hypothetical protein
VFPFRILEGYVKFSKIIKIIDKKN